jgi:hypothetical protein
VKEYCVYHILNEEQQTDKAGKMYTFVYPLLKTKKQGITLLFKEE